MLNTGKIAFELCQKYENMELEILVEEWDEKSSRIRGRSIQNKLVHALGQRDMIGQVVKVKVDEAFPQTLRGRVL